MPTFFTAVGSTAFEGKEQTMTFRKGKTLAAALLCAAALTGAASAAYTDTAGHWAEGAIDRVMWGSDAPTVLVACTYQQHVDCIVNYCDFLTDDELENLLGRTANRVWFGEA